MVTSNPGKSRKAHYNAPSHTKRKMLSAHLSKELSEKYGRKSARVCVGDTVRVTRGEEGVKGVEGKVLEVYTKTGRVSVEGVTVKQADSTEVVYPVHSSSLEIITLNLEDSFREEILNNKEAKE